MNILYKVGFVLLISWLFACNSGDDQDPVIVDLADAVLNDFPLFEVSYTDIQVRQPEIVDGEEITPGEIVITIPATFDILDLSLASVNFDVSKFEISPAVRSVQSFEAGNVITYTITSLEDPGKSIRYLVSVIKEEIPPVEEPKITDFRFEKSKNANLPSDIEALRIVEYPAMNSNVIYVLVPVNTDLANLVPSIDFEGEELEYRQGENDFSEYPQTDLNVDFRSDYDYLSFRDRNGFELSVNTPGTQNRYRVVVDVETPINLEENSVSTPVVTVGETRRFLYKWVNEGNHPVQHGMTASNYTDNAPGSKGNIFSAFLAVANSTQGGFIRPGEEGNISVTVDADGAAIGDYDMTIVFSPKYDLNRAMINDLVDDLNPIEDIFNTVELNVKTTVINRQ